MALMTWEIVCLVLALLSTFAASLYFIIKCFKSIRVIAKEAESRKQPVRHVKNCGKNVPDPNQGFGIPYRPPTPPVPQPLDPARLEDMVMGRRSDLHPKYLEHSDGISEGDRNQLDSSLDLCVSWAGDSALLDSEFVPSLTESPMVAGVNNSSATGASPRPIKMLHVSYERELDGAPVIKNMTTSVIGERDDKNDNVGQTGQTKCVDAAGTHAKVDDGVAENEMPRRHTVVCSGSDDINDGAAKSDDITRTGATPTDSTCDDVIKACAQLEADSLSTPVMRNSSHLEADVTPTDQTDVILHLEVCQNSHDSEKSSHMTQRTAPSGEWIVFDEVHGEHDNMSSVTIHDSDGNVHQHKECDA